MMQEKNMDTEYKCKLDNWPLNIDVINGGVGYCNALHGYKDCKQCINLHKR